jgi:hypothetical protein
MPNRKITFYILLSDSSIKELLESWLFDFAKQIILMGLFRRNKISKNQLLDKILNLFLDGWSHLVLKNTVQTKDAVWLLNQFVAFNLRTAEVCLKKWYISTGIGVSETLLKIYWPKVQQDPLWVMAIKNEIGKCLNPYYRLWKHYERILKSESQRNIIKEIKDQNIKLIDSTTISLCLNMFDGQSFDSKGV